MRRLQSEHFATKNAGIVFCAAAQLRILHLTTVFCRLKTRPFTMIKFSSAWLCGEFNTCVRCAVFNNLERIGLEVGKEATHCKFQCLLVYLKFPK